MWLLTGLMGMTDVWAAFGFLYMTRIYDKMIARLNWSEGVKMKTKLQSILETLDQLYGMTKENFDCSQPWQLLISIILSAQTTDRQVNQVLPVLFGKFPTVESLTRADVQAVMDCIRPVGLHKSKARNIIACCGQLADHWDGQVPKTMEQLLELPGVGRKTATLFLADAYGIPGITVDTHVFRISRRLGWAKGKTPAAVEKELEQVLPQDHWNRINFQLVAHGREVCTARKAKCDICPLKGWCQCIL